VVEMHRIKSFDYLIVNSSSFDFDEKKIDYFTTIGKDLEIKKVILTDSPEDPAPVTNDNIIVTSNPAQFLMSIDSIKKG
jgi:hypothetical protein